MTDYGKTILKAFAGDPIAIKTVEASVYRYVFGTAFNNLLIKDPQHAIEQANAQFEEANRAEYERQPVSLW